MDEPQNEKLKKDDILRHRKDFKHIFSFGRRLGNKYFQIVCDNNQQGQRRIAVVVGRKYGKAHLRNKIRRRIKEVYRLNKEKFSSERDYIIMPREAVKQLRFHEIKDSLIHLVENYNSQK